MGLAGRRPRPELLRRVDEMINQATVSGPRYPAQVQATIDTLAMAVSLAWVRLFPETVRTHVFPQSQESS